MALNGALLVEPDDAWGRTYVEHVEALARDEKVPAGRARGLPRRSSRRSAAGGRRRQPATPRGHVPVVEAARDVIAHA